MDQLVDVFAPGKGIALGKGQQRAVPEEDCGCELLAADAPGSWGNECPVLMESEQGIKIPTPLALMGNDTCMETFIAAIYLAKDWTVSISRDLVE